MTDLLSVLFDGIAYSSWLFIMAAGLTLIYGVMKILNIAHGSLYALGAYTAAALVRIEVAAEGRDRAEQLLRLASSDTQAALRHSFGAFVHQAHSPSVMAS